MVDWDGEGYEQISDLQRTLAKRSLSRLTLRGDEHCLDLGCGDGYLSRLIAVRLPRGSVLGIDASPRMIAVAKDAPLPPETDLEFELGNVLELTYDEEFDLVTSFNVLHWVTDQRTALTGIRAALHPAGHAVLQYVCAGSRPSVEDVAMTVCAQPRWQQAFDGFGPPFIHVEPAGYPALAADAGLTITALTVTDEEWDFGSREAFSRWCTVGFADWTSRLDSLMVTAWVDDVVDRYEQVSGRPGLFRFMQLVADLAPIPAGADPDVDEWIPTSDDQ